MIAARLSLGPRAAGVGLGLAVALGAPSAVLAHGLSATYQSPLPLAVYLVGAASTVALSFLFVLARDMRAAPFREHKLELASYLRSKDGAALLGRMAALSGGGETTVFATLAAIRPLELYMPVPKHRESWTGKADVLVVSQLDEWQPIVAFDQRGQQLALDRKVPPEQPTLSIIGLGGTKRAQEPQEVLHKEIV